VAENDFVTVDEDATSILIQVLSNDSDPDGDEVLLSSISQPANGTAQVTDGNASITYSPDPNFYGSDSIDYTIQDGYGGLAIATVTINVTSVNDVPVAFDDFYQSEEDEELTIPPLGILGNDIDIEGDALLSVLQSSPTNGMLELALDGSFTYTPNANFNGVDSFIYKANDGTDDSNLATVTISVLQVNDAPIANDDEYAIDEDIPLNMTAPGVLDNDSDVDGDSVTAILVEDVSNGILTLSDDGSLIYIPNANFNGVDTFTYRISDGVEESNLAAVSIEVSAVNDPPTAYDLTAIVEENGEVVITLGGSDVDQQSLSYVIVEGPSNGNMSNFNSSTGRFTYAPIPNYHGQDFVAFATNDGIVTSVTARVTITISPAPPTGGNGSSTVD
jgi:hypothetical protein